MKKHIFDRRKFLKHSLVNGLAISMGGLNVLNNSNHTARAQVTKPKKLLQIFLNGGWDSILSTDPVQTGSSKSLNGGYQSQYYDGSINNFFNIVPGKSNLHVGAGLYPAINAFATVPTCFINGMHIEVTAHELGVNYMLSGLLSTSRSREFPAIIARLGALSQNFPPHLILGSDIPLGETKLNTPPLSSLDFNQLLNLLGGPRANSYYNLTDSSIQAANELIEKLNQKHDQSLAANTIEMQSPWKASEKGLSSLYDKRFDLSMTLDDTIKNDYQIPNEEFASLESKIAGSYISLREGLTPYITVKIDGFDTHENHLSSHLPLQQRFATALNQLIIDLVKTNDPDHPGTKLIDQTTVLITSEFNRTPKFNLSGGTDHWQTGNAILLGGDIQDNQIIGGTDDQSKALGWDNNSLQNLSPTNALLPGHLSASILRHFSYLDEANKVSSQYLKNLYTNN